MADGASSRQPAGGCGGPDRRNPEATGGRRRLAPGRGRRPRGGADGGHGARGPAAAAGRHGVDAGRADVPRQRCVRRRRPGGGGGAPGAQPGHRAIRGLAGPHRTGLRGPGPRRGAARPAGGRGRRLADLGRGSRPHGGRDGRRQPGAARENAAPARGVPDRGGRGRGGRGGPRGPGALRAGGGAARGRARGACGVDGRTRPGRRSRCDAIGSRARGPRSPHGVAPALFQYRGAPAGVAWGTDRDP